MNSPNLIDTSDIATRYGMNRDYVTNRLTKRPDFPAPRVNVSQRMRKWAADEVEAFMRQGQSRAAICSADSR